VWTTVAPTNPDVMAASTPCDDSASSRTASFNLDRGRRHRLGADPARRVDGGTRRHPAARQWAEQGDSATSAR
jgi:hypothetical protein